LTNKAVPGEKENSISSINRRPGLSGEMQLQLRKSVRFPVFFYRLERAYKAGAARAGTKQASQPRSRARPGR
jgi:hypothetical protein